MILNIFKKRRSIFPPQFNNENVTDTEINTLLEAANWAPSHLKTEPWRFKVIKSESARKKFSEFISKTYKEKTSKFSEIKFKKLKGMPLKSQAIITICIQRDKTERMPEWEEIAAVAMAIQNLWLQATKMDIGGFWSSPTFIINEIYRFFKLNKGETCLGFFYLGKYDEHPLEARREDISKKTIWL